MQKIQILKIFRVPSHNRWPALCIKGPCKGRGVSFDLTLVLLGGVIPTPLTVFALLLKIAQPRGKIAPGTFKFILSLHFSEKIPNLPPTPGVG